MASRRQQHQPDTRRSGSSAQPTSRLRTGETDEDDSDADGDDLVVGFNHTMTTAQRQEMRERESRARGKASRAQSSSPTPMSGISSTHSTRDPGYSRSTHESTTLQQRRSAYARELIAEKRSRDPSQSSMLSKQPDSARSASLDRHSGRASSRDHSYRNRDHETKLSRRTAVDPSRQYRKKDAASHDEEEITMNTRRDNHKSNYEEDDEEKRQRREREARRRARYEESEERKKRREERRRKEREIQRSDSGYDKLRERVEGRRRERGGHRRVSSTDGTLDDIPMSKADRDRRREERRLLREKEYNDVAPPTTTIRRARSSDIDQDFSLRSQDTLKTEFSSSLVSAKSNNVSSLSSHRTKYDAPHDGASSNEKNQSTNEQKVVATKLPHCESSSEEEGEENKVEDVDDESSSDNLDERMWTVRVYLISIVDLPFNIVPNTPLCPVLKFGLVKTSDEDLKDKDNLNSSSYNTSNRPKSALVERIEKDGLSSIPKARVRCTSNKILSKRDNGSIEFHEEMRWDNVKRPDQTALAVELCARGVRPPPNMSESPLAKPKASASSLIGGSTMSADTSDMQGSYRSITSNSSRYDDRDKRRVNTSQGGTDSAPTSGNLSNFLLSSQEEGQNTAEADEYDDQSQVSGIISLWNKGRQQFKQRQAAKRKSSDEMEASTAAAAVARYLIGGKEEGGDVAASEPYQNTTGGDESEPSLSRASSNFGTDLASSKRTTSHDRHLRSGEENVALIRPKKKRKTEMAQDLTLGSLIIPLTKLPLTKATEGNEAARVETWYMLDASSNSLVPSRMNSRGSLTASKLAARRNPSILLEISFSSPELLDESEDEVEVDSDVDKPLMASGMIEENEVTPGLSTQMSFSRRTSMDFKQQSKKAAALFQAEKAEAQKEKKQIDQDPVLASGVCDFIAVVGATNIGDQSHDNGAKGWVKSNPECAILEQFPPNDEFHAAEGRNVTLQNKAEWFCFPEGCRLWRGAEPPTHSDLNLKRFSASSPPNVASSIAAFDACLNCTTSFSWFVMQSNEKENDFKNVKTYGAVIKFYARAPPGIDSTQDDFAQAILPGLSDSQQGNASQARRLWVPLGILLTSNLPIIGVMEAMLLRLCEILASRTSGPGNPANQKIDQIIREDLANLIINFQKPIPGVINCSIPFLTGERLYLTVPPPTGLPTLPHGSSVTSVCRLLGSEGLTLLLAAVLTESKIIIHSDEIANLAMVAEVITALIYPFIWSLPYLPVLPEQMLEMVEAPLSYFFGVLSCNMKFIDESVFSEVVVIDLDNGFTCPDYYEGRRGGRQTKSPCPLPASVASNISKAVFRLLREEEDIEEEYGSNNMHGGRSLPRLEQESLAEREFRIAVALQICGLVRGFDECVFKVPASQPVFNRDKFLRNAPALFEERRGNVSNSAGPGGQPQRMMSPRSKRFLSILTNCQHFQQFLEMLDQDECAFFNEVMYTFDRSEEKIDSDIVNPLAGYGSGKLEESACHLIKALQKVEDKIPLYRVDRSGRKKNRGVNRGDGNNDSAALDDVLEIQEADNDLGFSDDGNLISSFTSDLLQQLTIDPRGMGMSNDPGMESVMSQGALAALFLAEFEKGNHWHYNKLLDIPQDPETGIVKVREKVKLREAIGDRRYRAWKLAQEQKTVERDNSNRLFTGDTTSTSGNSTLDLSSLVSQVSEETVNTDISSAGALTSFSKFTRKNPHSSLPPEQQKFQDARDRDILRRCLERAYQGSSRRRSGGQNKKGKEDDPFYENGRDLIAVAEAALRNPSGQKFLVSILSQRPRLEDQRKKRSIGDDRGRRGETQPTVSRLESPAFDCLVRLCLAMLDACLESRDYESGYKLLTHTQGFCTIQSKDGKPISKKDAISDNTNILYMTARVSLHPIFAELELWEGVLHMRIAERAKDRKDDDSEDAKDADDIDYDTTVSTLYEMLALGVPSEELARFAHSVSEKKGWFATEKGQNLLLQARRLTAKRESGNEAAGNTGDLDMMRTTRMQEGEQETIFSNYTDEMSLEWKTIGWCHPAAAASSRASSSQMQSESERNMANGRVGQNLLNMIGKEPKKDDDTNKYLKRSPVTTLASFGSSIVASGGLDGSVFVAHSINFADDIEENQDTVHGVCLDWGSSGSRTSVVGSGSTSMDGEYGVGAVSCLAAAKGAGYRSSALSDTGGSMSKDVGGKPDEDDVLQAMEGCRVVAGTTGGDLRVWSVKEVYAATTVAKKGESDDASKSMSQMRISHGGEDGGTASSYVSRTKRGSMTEITVGSAFSRLKVSLRGRALSGHRGGVTCIDVPSHIYRPDALVTGGADGFIKLWSLRNPTGRRGSELTPAPSAPLFNTSNLTAGNASETLAQSRTKGSRGGDALSILSGHTGRVLCVKTAWHGDRLLSGGADCTVRVWDLSSSGNGKCLHELRGHLGWVTQSHYWGPNTIVSASSDRAIALWDARVRRSPLFILRYHKSPISDLLVGARTDPLMVSAASDGTIATWDFRTLSGRKDEDTKTHASSSDTITKKKCKAIRTPSATIMHCAEGKGAKQAGSVLLSRSPGRQRRTVLSVGVDAVIREWDMMTGRQICHESTSHADVISSFHTFPENSHGSAVDQSDGGSSFGGTLTSSWDGTIRMRKLVQK